MKIYISGPMAGYENLNFPAFDEAERLLVASGYDALNPARHGQGDQGVAYYMRRAFHDVLAADGVATLSGWTVSKGAQMEVRMAEMLDLPVKGLELWIR